MKKHKWEQDQISHMKVPCLAAATYLCTPFTAVVLDLSEDFNGGLKEHACNAMT